MEKKNALNEINKYVSKAVKVISEKKLPLNTNLAKQVKNSIKQNNKLGIAQFYNHLGIMESKKSSFDRSLDYYLKAIYIYRELGHKKAIAQVYNNMGNVFISTIDFKKAKECFDKSIAISTDLDNKELLLKALTNCGLVNVKLKNHELALKNYTDALDLCRVQGNTNSQSSLLSEIGALYIELKEYNKAIECFEEVIKIETDRNSVYGVAHANFRIAENNYCLDNLDEAISYNKKALDAAIEVDNKALHSYCCILFSNIYEKLGDYKESLKYFKSYSNVREEVLEETRVRKISEIQARFELYKKQKENELQILKNQKLKDINKKLQIAYKNAENVANTDFLTKLLNRRSIYKYVNENLINKKKQFAVILSDIDDFKKINDTYGHDAGDLVLVEISERFQTCLGNEIKFARWGGEEFLILLPDMSLNQGIAFAEKLRICINSSPFIYKGQAIQVSMTFGVNEYNGEDDFNEIIKKADSALYTGKSRGKNCVV